jgi:predicted alpha/beta hydrolase
MTAAIPLPILQAWLLIAALLLVWAAAEVVGVMRREWRRWCEAADRDRRVRTAFAEEIERELEAEDVT